MVSYGSLMRRLQFSLIWRGLAWRSPPQYQNVLHPTLPLTARFSYILAIFVLITCKNPSRWTCLRIHIEPEESQNMPLPDMPLGYFERKALKSSRCKKAAQASPFLPESRRQSLHVKDAPPAPGGKGRPRHQRPREIRANRPR